jgi:hypothetical protein
VVLSPDDVWTVIQLSLSRYVNMKPETAEHLRAQLVNFQGRKEIIVQMPACVGNEAARNLDWGKFTGLVREAMAANMCPGVVEDVCPAFSTTGPFQQLVSQAILMDCFQAYFEITCRLSCGITQVRGNTCAHASARSSPPFTPLAS